MVSLPGDEQFIHPGGVGYHRSKQLHHMRLTYQVNGVFSYEGVQNVPSCASCKKKNHVKLDSSSILHMPPCLILETVYPTDSSRAPTVNFRVDPVLKAGLKDYKHAATIVHVPDPPHFMTIARIDDVLYLAGRDLGADDMESMASQSLVMDKDMFFPDRPTSAVFHLYLEAKSDSRTSLLMEEEASGAGGEKEFTGENVQTEDRCEEESPDKDMMDEVTLSGEKTTLLDKLKSVKRHKSLEKGKGKKAKRAKGEANVEVDEGKKKE